MTVELAREQESMIAARWLWGFGSLVNQLPLDTKLD